MELNSFSLEISCLPPKVAHGEAVSRKNVYKENERIQYHCKQGFEHSVRAEAVCTSSGWSPEPSCEGNALCIIRRYDYKLCE